MFIIYGSLITSFFALLMGGANIICNKRISKKQEESQKDLVAQGEESQKDLAAQGEDFQKDLAAQGEDFQKDLAAQGEDFQKDLAAQGKEFQKYLSEQEERFQKSLSALDVEVQLNQIANPNFMDELEEYDSYDENGKHLSSGKTDPLKIFMNSGWISKIYIIDSCFKNENNPYVDTSVYYNNSQKLGKDLQEKTEECPLFWFKEHGNRIDIFSKKYINFYPELNRLIFYKFYLIEGSDRKYNLYMYCLDERDCDEGFAPFLLDKKSITSTVKTVNNTFRTEYIKLLNYLKEFGFEVI